MNDKFPTIVRTYFKIMCEMEVPHDLMDCEYDGVEYETFDEAWIAMQEAEKNKSYRIYNMWIDGFAIDTNGDIWDYDPEWRAAVEDSQNSYKDENGHSEYGLYGEEN